MKAGLEYIVNIVSGINRDGGEKRRWGRRKGERREREKGKGEGKEKGKRRERGGGEEER